MLDKSLIFITNLLTFNQLQETYFKNQRQIKSSYEKSKNNLKRHRQRSGRMQRKISPRFQPKIMHVRLRKNEHRSRLDYP